MSRTVAAIDVGTNSVRLFVTERTAGRDRPIDRDLVITRLGEGVDANRTIAAPALERTVDAIARYHRRARDAGADPIRIGATSAVRDAGNRDEFVAAVREATGVTPEVLTGEQEARLSFLGATSELGAGGPFLVLDIGGGSTELVLGTDDVEAWISVDVGSVRLTERHVRHDPPLEAEIDALRAEADVAVEEAREAVGAAASTLVGLAGTITTVAAVALGLGGYDRDRIHHATLTAGDVRRIGAMLAGMRVDDRRRLPAMPPGREDVIVAGATIMLGVMEGLGFGEILVSEADLLDGLILEGEGDA